MYCTGIKYHVVVASGCLGYEITVGAVAIAVLAVLGLSELLSPGSTSAVYYKVAG